MNTTSYNKLNKYIKKYVFTDELIVNWNQYEPIFETNSFNMILS